MMKKITITLMMFTLMVVLAACGGNNDKASGTSVDGNQEEPQEVEEVEVEEAATIEITHILDQNPVTVDKKPETVVVFDFGMLDTLDELGVEVAGLATIKHPSIP